MPLQILYPYGKRVVLIIAMLGLCAMFIPGGDKQGLLFIGRLCDAAHFPIFGAVTYALFVLTEGRIRRSIFPTYVLVPFCSIWIAVAVEIIQPFVNREASYWDLVVGACGIIVATAWYYVSSSPKISRTNQLYSYAVFLSILVISMVIVLFPAWEEFNLYQWQKSRLPILSDFESVRDVDLWHPYQWGGDENCQSFETKEVAYEGRHALKVILPKSSVAGVKYSANQHDWSKYKVLSIQIFNPDDAPIDISIRIDDAWKSQNYFERFNTKRTLAYGWNSINITIDEILNYPYVREFHISKIANAYIFTTGKDKLPRVIYIDKIELR